MENPPEISEIPSKSANNFSEIFTKSLYSVRTTGLEKIRRRESEVIRVLAEGLKGREDFRVFDDPAGESSVLSVRCRERLPVPPVSRDAGTNPSPHSSRPVPWGP